MIIPAMILSSRAIGATSASPKLAVVNAVDLPANLADLRAKLTGELGAAVKQHSYDFVPDTASCTDQACLTSLAAQSGASDVLVVSGGKNDYLGYRIELRLWDASSGREDHSSAECNTCSASQMIENVVRAAGPLLDRLPTLHATVAPVVPVAPPLVSTNPSPAPVVSTSRSPARLALGLSLIGVGAVAGATGIFLWSRDGDPTNCGAAPGQTCSTIYDTRTPGIALTVGGLLAAGAGTVVLMMRSDSRSVAIGLTPSTLTIAGTY